MKLFFSVLIFSVVFCLQSCFRSSKIYFQDFFGFTPTEDVKNLNSFGDELGIDASYWLAFECNDSTIGKIVTNLQLTKSEIETNGLIGGLNTQPTPWWDTAFVSHSKPFTRQDDRILWYLWYNNKTKRAYFLTLDL